MEVSQEQVNQDFDQESTLVSRTQERRDFSDLPDDPETLWRARRSEPERCAEPNPLEWIHSARFGENPQVLQRPGGLHAERKQAGPTY